MVNMILGSVVERDPGSGSRTGTVVPVAVEIGPRRPVEKARFLSERVMNECPFIMYTAGEKAAGPVECAEADLRRHPSGASAAGFFASLMNECTFTWIRSRREFAAARPRVAPRAVPRAARGWVG